jgi:hypothetical protein
MPRTFSSPLKVVSAILGLWLIFYVTFHVFGWAYVASLDVAGGFTEVRMGRILQDDLYLQEDFEIEYSLERPDYVFEIKNIGQYMPVANFTATQADGERLPLTGRIISEEQTCGGLGDLGPEEVYGKYMIMFGTGRCRSFEHFGKVTLLFVIQRPSGEILGEETFELTVQRNGFYAILDAL